MPIYAPGAIGAVPIKTVSQGDGTFALNVTGFYIDKIKAMGPIQYLPMSEPSGSVALDASGNGRVGAYTGVTLGQTGIGDGRTAASFDGATSYLNIYSTSLNAAFTGGEASVIIWGILGAAAWIDGIQRIMVRLFVDANNHIDLYKKTTNNTLEIDYVAGGTVKGAAFATGGPTTPFCVGVTVTKSSDAMKLYFNGVQQGATLTGLGTWAGALSSTLTLVGAQTAVPAQVWNGRLADYAIFNRALSAAEMLSAATV